jgi:hypothetical protein
MREVWNVPHHSQCFKEPKILIGCGKNPLL